MTVKELLVRNIGGAAITNTKYKHKAPTYLFDLMESGQDHVAVRVSLHNQDLYTQVSNAFTEAGYDDIRRILTKNELIIEGRRRPKAPVQEVTDREEILRGNGKAEFMQKQDAQNKQGNEKYSVWVDNFQKQGHRGYDTDWETGTWEDYINSVEKGSKNSTISTAKDMFSPPANEEPVPKPAPVEPAPEPEEEEEPPCEKEPEEKEDKKDDGNSSSTTSTDTGKVKIDVQINVNSKDESIKRSTPGMRTIKENELWHDDIEDGLTTSERIGDGTHDLGDEYDDKEGMEDLVDRIKRIFDGEVVEVDGKPVRREDESVTTFSNLGKMLESIEKDMKKLTEVFVGGEVDPESAGEDESEEAYWDRMEKAWAEKHKFVDENDLVDVDPDIEVLDTEDEDQAIASGLVGQYGDSEEDEDAFVTQGYYAGMSANRPPRGYRYESVTDPVLRKIIEEAGLEADSTKENAGSDTATAEAPEAGSEEGTAESKDGMEESTADTRKKFYSGVQTLDHKGKRKLKLGDDDKHLRSIALQVAFEKPIEDKMMFDFDSLPKAELVKRIQAKYPVGKKEAEYIFSVARLVLYRPQQVKGVNTFCAGKKD